MQQASKWGVLPRAEGHEGCGQRSYLRSGDDASQRRPSRHASWRSLARCVLAAAVAITFSACGGGDPPEVTSSEVTNEVARGAVLADSGTVIAVPNGATGLAGARVEIPAGAAKDDVEVQVGYSNSLPAPIRSEAVAVGATPVSAVVELKVANGGPTTFNRPVTVTIPFDVAAAGNLPPTVVFWDPAASRYRPVSVVAVDRAAGNVTFRTSHFSRYMAVVVRSLGAAAPSVDTGFRMGVDSILHPNFSAYFGSNGVCAAFAAMSTTYYGMNRPTPLHTFAQQGVSNQPLDDDLTRSAMLLTYATVSDIWRDEVIENRFSLTDADAGLLVLEAMIVTGEPVHFTMRGTDVAHAVTVYGYDSTTARFQIYDSNFPQEEVTFDWNLVSGFGAYSKSDVYPRGMFTRIGYVTDSSFGAPEKFESIVNDWEAGRLPSYFDHLTINSAQGVSESLAVGRSVTTTIPYQDNQTVTGRFLRPAGTTAATYLHVYYDGVKQGVRGIPLGESGAFALNFPTRLEARLDVMLLVSQGERDPDQRLTAFGRFTVQPQGQNFFVNFGFETGDLTGWNQQTTLLRGGSVFTPTKATVVAAGFDPIAADLPTAAFGRFALRINDQTPGYHRTFVSQRATVPATGNPQLAFRWAAVLEAPDHSPDDQPYVEVSVRNLTRNEDLYRRRFFASDPSFPGWRDHRGGTWQSIPWQSVVLPGLSGYANDEIEVRIEGADCNLGGHGGYVYLDGEE